MRLHRIVLTAVLAAIAVPAAALAATNTYVARSFTQPASAGRPVDKPLDEFKAVAGARVVVRSDWKTTTAKPGQLRFTSGNNICHYTTTYRVRTRIADDGSAEDYVTGALPSPGRGYVLDSGTHGSAAFRVVRQKTTNGVIRIDALWSRVLTKRKDIAPSGKVISSDIVVSATSGAGDECHAGTYRDVLGPRIGDSLATAQTSLRFVKK